jgi:hypothetical protein
MEKHDLQYTILEDLHQKADVSFNDMLACVCANLCHYTDTEFKTELMCGGHEFKVKIDKK